MTRPGERAVGALTVADDGPRGGEPAHGLLELVAGAGPRDPDEPVEPALGGEHRARGDDDAAALGLGDDGGAERGRAARTTAPARRSAAGTATRAGARRPPRPARRAARAAGPGARRGSARGSASRWSARAARAPARRGRGRPGPGSAGPSGRGAPGSSPGAGRPRSDLLALPIVIVSGAYAANGRGICLALERERLVRLVDHGDRAGARAGGRRTPRAARRSSGGRSGSGSRGSGRPAAARSGAGWRRRRRGPSRRGRPGAGTSRAPAVPDRLGGVGVDRRLDEHPVAGPGERLRHDRGRGQRARRDHDLLGRRSAGRARRTSPRSRACSRGQPGREVAVPAEVRRQLGRAPRRRRRRGPGGAEAAAQLRSIASVVAGPGQQRPVVGAAPAARHAGEGARAPAAPRRTRRRAARRTPGSPWSGETPRASVSSRSLGSRVSSAIRPSPIRSAQARRPGRRTPGSGRSRRPGWPRGRH